MSDARVFFGGGLPDPRLVPPIADLLDAVVRDDAAALTYGGPSGYEPLRAAIAARLAARAHTALGSEHVVLTNGSAGALELVARHVLAPGTVVAVEDVTYRGALDIFGRRGATIVPVPIDDDGLDVDALERIVDEGGPGAPTVVYTIATCQSPTGTMLAPERREQLAALADRAGLTVIQDDTYGEILFDARGTEPVIGLAPQRTIHVGSFSKTLAPGLRLGWLTARVEVCSAIAESRTDLGTTPIVQRAVGRLFADGRYPPHVDAITPVYREKRDTLVDALDRHCAGMGVWTVPRGGFFVWLTMHDADVDAVARYGAPEGVAFLGGPLFSAGVPHVRSMRLAYGEVPIERLEEGVRRLARAIGRASSRGGIDG